MTKKDFFSAPFIVGIGIMVLVVTAAVVLALPECNERATANKNTHSEECSDFHDSAGSSCADAETCDGAKEYLRGYDSINSDEYYFGTKQGGSADHAVVGGELPCLFMKYCKLDDNGTCDSSAGEDVLEEDTGERVEKKLTRYKDDSCTRAS